MMHSYIFLRCFSGVLPIRNKCLKLPQFIPFMQDCSPTNLDQINIVPPADSPIFGHHNLSVHVFAVYQQKKIKEQQKMDALGSQCVNSTCVILQQVDASAVTFECMDIHCMHCPSFFSAASARMETYNVLSSTDCTSWNYKGTHQKC